jgi:RNA recognition motif-containing protein
MAKEIYVGHISENATEEDVWKLFSVMGTVTSVHLIINPETGEFKRCGYVRMQSGIDLNEVVETLDGTYLIDREIVVSIARPQKPGMSKSGGNKQPWMKSGPKPEARPEAKPGARPKTRTDSTTDQRDRPAKAIKPGEKPSATGSGSTSFQGKRPAGSGRTPRPRTTK